MTNGHKSSRESAASYPGRGLHGEVVREFGLRIIRGDYEPGAIIDRGIAAEELGVSETVVREALRVMGAKGLVDSRPKLGTFVRERDAWNLLDSDVIMWRREAHRDSDRLLVDLAELREVVEPASARLAAERRTPADLALLDSALEAMRVAGRNTDQIVQADQDFHLALLGAAHNEMMTRLDVLIIHAVSARDRIYHRPGNEWSDPVPEHAGVLEAVRAQDGEGAAAAMTFLLRQSLDESMAGEPPFEPVE